MRTKREKRRRKNLLKEQTTEEREKPCLALKQTELERKEKQREAVREESSESHSLLQLSFSPLSPLLSM